MSKHDIIVIGGSAGALEALRVLLAGLPADLPAAVFVVIHVGNGADGKSYLPEILSKAGPLPAKEAEDRESIVNGQIYCPRPNFHLQVAPGCVRVINGPKENFTRPAINPLFRSAAQAYGPRVQGVVLTGTLDDGTSGLAEIKRKGGVTVVQDPATALFPSMPANAIRYVDVDYVVGLSELPALLSRLARTEQNAPEEVIEIVNTELTNLTCPECRGPLEVEHQGRITEFRCRVGHVFTPLGLLREHDAALERSIWAAIVALEESADITDKLSKNGGGAESEMKRDQARQLRVALDAMKRAG